MARLLYGLLGTNLLWILTCIAGTAINPSRLEFWSQGLTWGLIAVVILAPLAVFAPKNRGAVRRTSAPRRPRSWTRVAAYTVGIGIGVWFFVSLFSLFLDQQEYGFWSMSLLGAFIAIIVWAPILVFAYNPLRDPKATPQAAAMDDTPPLVPDAVREDALPESPSISDAPDDEAASSRATRSPEPSKSPEPPTPAGPATGTRRPAAPASNPRRRERAENGDADSPDAAAPSDPNWPE